MLLYGASPAASTSGTSRSFLLIVVGSGGFAGLFFARRQPELTGSRGTLPHCTVSGGKTGPQHGREVEGEEKPLNGVSWTPGEPGEHPSSPATRPCRRPAAASQHQTSAAGHSARLPSGSPFPNLINEAALEALLHSAQVPKTPAGPRDGAEGWQTRGKGLQLQRSAASGGNQPFHEKEEKSWENSLPLF